MMLCSRITDKAQYLFSVAILFFVTAVVARIFVHPKTDFARGFVDGFTTVLFAAEIVFLLLYMVELRRRKRANAAPCS